MKSKLNLKIIIRLLVVICILVGIYLINYFYFTDTVSVLMYHDVDKVENKAKYYPTNFTSIDNFEKQMKFLKDNGYTTVTLDEVYDFVKGNKKLPKRCVLITFDDGRKDILKNAYPIMKNYKFKGTIFVIGKNIENKDAQTLTIEELSEMNDVFETASHTYNMHERDKKTNEPYIKIKTKEEITEDLQNSLKYVDEPYFAYPFGAYPNTSEFRSILLTVGIKAAFITKHGKVRNGDCVYKLRRNEVNDEVNFDRFRKFIGDNKKSIL